jgi:hypothetical protein
MESLLQQASDFEPIGEALDPVIGGDILFVHAEPMSAL